MNTNACRSLRSKKRNRNDFRPAVLDLEERVMLSSGAGEQPPAEPRAATLSGPLHIPDFDARLRNSHAHSSRIIPTVDQNPGLSVKRVPGFLPGWKVPDLATPFDNANELGRMIDNSTVDYWAITLNKLDSVTLTIYPTGTSAATDFSVRVWGPDNKEIGTAVSGAALVCRQDLRHLHLRYFDGGQRRLSVQSRGDAAQSLRPDNPHVQR